MPGILLAAAAAMAALGGCSQPAAPAVWAGGDMLHLTQSTRAHSSATYDAAQRSVGLFGGGNETVSFQLVVDAPPEGVNNLRLAVGPLRGEAKSQLPADRVRIWRMLPTAVDRYPAWYLRLTDGPVRPERFYDALADVPDSLGLAPNERAAFWVDLSIPRGAQPGHYAGSISVRYHLYHRYNRMTRGQQVSVRIDLRVYDFVLPDSRPLTCIGGFSHETIFRQFVRAPGRDGRPAPFVPVRLDPSSPPVREGLVVVRQLMRLARDHRLDLFDRDLRPQLRRDPDGKCLLVWDDYDAVARPYLDGTAFDDRLGVPAWPLPVSATWPDPGDYGGPGTEAYADTLRAVLEQSVAHAAALSAGERTFLWPRIAPTGADAYERFARWARPIRAAQPELTLLSELPPAAPPETGLRPPPDMPALAQMWAAPGNLAWLSQAPTLALPGRELSGLWLCPGPAPYLPTCGVLASPADIRALAWLAVKYRCAGIFLDEVLGWQDAAPLDEHRLLNPAPAGQAVLPSVRLKRLRRGLQDAAYLWVLRQRHREGVADALVNSLVFYGGLDAAGDNLHDVRLDGHVRDGEAWLAARRLLAEEVAAAVHPEQVNKQNLAAQRLAWKKLQQSTSRVRAERVRCRLAQAGAKWRATIQVDLYNELGATVNVELRLGELPEGWTPLAGQLKLDDLPPAARRTVELTAEGPELPPNLRAKNDFRLRLTTDLGQDEPLLAGAPYLRSGQAVRPIVVDGMLRDWPLREGNTAADFRPLGRRGAVARVAAATAEAARAAAAPEASADPTAVFATFDDDNLYFAFRCGLRPGQKLRAAASNVVRYEQLLSCDEDLVEVLLDPGGQARSASDLYHLTVKCNGIVLTERGVRGDPPLGACRAWACAAGAAVARQGDTWIVELAVPRSAFGPDGRKDLWGVNFTRYSTAASEASSWTGAARSFYDPRELGTMRLTPKQQD